MVRHKDFDQQFHKTYRIKLQNNQIYNTNCAKKAKMRNLRIERTDQTQ